MFTPAGSVDSCEYLIFTKSEDHTHQTLPIDKQPKANTAAS